MRHLPLSVALIAGLLLSAGLAQAQSAGTATASCKDGMSFTGAKRSGACRGNGGMQSWGAAELTTIPVNAPAERATPGPTTTRRAAPAPASRG